MLRLTRHPLHEPEPETPVTLRIEGRLTRGDVSRLQAECTRLLEAGRPLRLDLSGLQFADRAAVATLQALRQRGVSLTGASGFVDALLADAGL
jgi:ABC-type transporter Mla MlaB component